MFTPRCDHTLGTPCVLAGDFNIKPADAHNLLRVLVASSCRDEVPRVGDGVTDTDDPGEALKCSRGHWQQCHPLFLSWPFHQEAPSSVERSLPRSPVPGW